MRWEVANPVTFGALYALMQSGVDVTGTFTLSLPSEDPGKVAAVEEAAAEAGLVLVRIDDPGVEMGEQPR